MNNREWTLEGGALVLADRGVCLIDEFDKMNDADRTSIHEAMEQQSISISKAGIVTTLKARCAVIAAANPIGGRYDWQRTLAENVELTDPILSRFDCLCVLVDEVDPMQDERLAKFVVGSHIRSHPVFIEQSKQDTPDETNQTHQFGTVLNDAAKPTIRQDLLKKYLTYARLRVRPQLGEGLDKDKVAKLYADLRRHSNVSGGVPVAVRHIESILRMAEAHARMHLRNTVREDDVDMAIRVMLESFIQAQKFSVQRSLRRHFMQYISYNKDDNVLLMHVLQGLVKDANEYVSMSQSLSQGADDEDNVIEIDIEHLESRAKELNIHNLKTFFKSHGFRNGGFQLDRARGVVLKKF